MDSNSPTRIPLITVVPPKSSTEINRSHEKIIKKKIAELKKWSDVLQKIAHKDALQKRKVFLEKQNLMHQAFLSFAESTNNLRQIMVICPSREKLEVFSSLCSLEQDMYHFTPNHLSTSQPILTKRTKSRIRKKNKKEKKMIRKEKPLESRSRSWSHGEKQRLRQCGREIDASLEPAKFYLELCRRFGSTVHSDSSVRQKAIAQDIKPTIWLNLNKC